MGAQGGTPLLVRVGSETHMISSAPRPLSGHVSAPPRPLNAQPRRAPTKGGPHVRQEVVLPACALGQRV